MPSAMALQVLLPSLQGGLRVLEQPQWLSSSPAHLSPNQSPEDLGSSLGRHLTAHITRLKPQGLGYPLAFVGSPRYAQSTSYVSLCWGPPPTSSFIPQVTLGESQTDTHTHTHPPGTSSAPSVQSVALRVWNLPQLPSPLGPTLQVPVPDVSLSVCPCWQASWPPMRWCRC